MNPHENINEEYKEFKKCRTSFERESNVNLLAITYLQLVNDLDSKSRQLEASVKSLDEANLGIFELTVALKKSETVKNDQTNTIESLKSRIDTVEDQIAKNAEKVYEDDRRISRIASENSILVNIAHKHRIEYIELKRNIENVESEMKNDEIFCDVLEKRDLSTEEIIGKLQKEFDSMFEEYSGNLTNVETYVQNVDNDIALNENLKLKCEKSYHDKMSLEENCVALRSEYDILTSLAKNAEGIMRSDFLLSTVNVCWKNTSENLRKKMNQSDDHLEKLIHNLKILKLENLELIILLDKYRDENESLKKKLEKSNAESLK
ncbi:hypothetical protein HHI36_005946 [Cryptolaemus montrouzieri]|uniref:Uncharacterized protein n=1 Tax=Cryptolaemus montrouzieri TaxID=559131 RepID=A0ABD2NVW3_9CUCU